MLKNNGNIYVTEKASKGKAIRVKKFGGGGTMGASDRGYQGGGRDSKGNVSGEAPGAGGSTNTGGGENKTTKPASTKTYKESKNIFKGANRDVPFNKPFGYKSQIAAGLLGIGPALSIANFGAKQNYKSRQKFATKEGLARDFYRMENKPLQPNSAIGKNYLKDAGFGKNKNPINTGKDGGQQKCPDGSLPPCSSVASTPKVDANLVSPKDNFFNFKAYKVGGLSGGVRYGPPPKRGPNPNVPPIKMKHGSKKEIKAGYHKMPDGSIMKNSAHKGRK